MAAQIEDVEIRPARVERDAELIGSLDTSFETGTVFDVRGNARAFELVERPLHSPLVKTFPLDDLDSEREWESAWLALAGGGAVGVVATQFEAWNRRMIIWHLYVNPGYRRRGVGRRLLDTALTAAVEAGARNAWVETSNLNVPAVRAYERLGFQLCGLDTSLYEGTRAEGEIALFLRRSLVRTPPQ